MPRLMSALPNNHIVGVGSFFWPHPVVRHYVLVTVVAQNNVSGSPNTARQLGAASLVLSIIGIIIGVVCWGLVALPVS